MNDGYIPLRRTPEQLARIEAFSSAHDTADLAKSLGGPDEWCEAARIYLAQLSNGPGRGDVPVSRAALQIVLGRVTFLEARAYAAKRDGGR